MKLRIGDRAQVRGLSSQPSKLSPLFEGKEVIIREIFSDRNAVTIDLPDHSASLTNVHMACLWSVKRRETFNEAYDRTLAEAIKRIDATPSRTSLSVLKHRSANQADCGKPWNASLRSGDYGDYHGFGKTPRAAMRDLLKNIRAATVRKNIAELIMLAAAKRYSHDVGQIEITLRKIAGRWSASVSAGGSSRFTQGGHTCKEALQSAYRAITEENEQ